jgi:SHS2 domain-containing protein
MAENAPPSAVQFSDASWETFDHGSDVGVRGYGTSPADAFANAGIALTAVITEPTLVRPRRRETFACAADDLEMLFLDWINALVTRMATEGLVFGAYEVTIRDGRLRGSALGEPIERRRHAPAVEVKGATLTELKVAREPGDGRWLAQCVVDV